MIAINIFFIVPLVIVFFLLIFAFVLLQRERSKVTVAEEERNTVLNNIPAAFVHLDKDYVVRWESSVVLGESVTHLRKYIVGQVCYKTVFGLSEPCSHCPMTSVFESGKRSSYIDTAGDFTLKLTAIPLQSSIENKMIGGVLQVEDITEQINREKIERDIKEAMEFSLQATNAVNWEIDTKTHFLSSPNLKLCASEKRGSIETYIAECIHPEHQAHFAWEMNQLLSGEKSEIDIVSQAYFSLGREGVYEWVQTKGKALNPDENGRYLKVFGTQQLVTDEVLRQKELEETNAQMEMTFEAANLNPWELDLESDVFSSINPNVIEARGVTLYECLTFVHNDDRGIVEDAINLIRRNQKDSLSIQVRISFPGDELKERWFEISGKVSRRDSSMKPTRIIGIRRDIMHLKRTDELIRLRNKAEESNRLMSAFLANMSHEIRTPLNAIVGFSNLIYNVETEEEKDHFLQIIESNCEYLLQLINDILDISKIESGKLDLSYASFSLNKLFEEQRATFQLRLDPSVKIVFEHTDTDFILYSDERRVKQVLINILSNALKYTTEGQITFGYKIEEEQLYVYVTDTGDGIPEDKLNTVFDRFVKIDSFKQGTGLGLFICKSIIDSLGGNIGVRSTLREGSTFWFTIPAVHPSDFEDAQLSPPSISIIE